MSPASAPAVGPATGRPETAGIASASSRISRYPSSRISRSPAIHPLVSPDPISCYPSSRISPSETRPGRRPYLRGGVRRLFDQSLLDFNACQPFPPEEGRGCEWVIGAIDSILAAPRRVRVRSFRFVMYGQGFAGREGVIARWFRTLAHRGVQEVDIDMLYTVPKPLLPSSLLMFDSLKTLRICCCNFPDAARGLRLPALNVLDLSNIGMSQHSLEAMLSNCPSLECAKLKSIMGIDKICLRSNSLMRLFGDFGNLQELVVEDAPNLEELVGIGLPSGKAKVKIVSAPKLQALGYLGIIVRPLVLHDTIFDGGIVQARTLMCCVKTLAIQVPFLEKGYTIFVAQLLKCFPCIESLHVQSDSRSLSRRDEVEKWNFDTSIQCIEHSINKLVFEDFEGEEWQCEFLYFLLRMTRALKFVEFYCSQSKDWANDQMEMMGHKNRASPDVQFLFFTSSEPKQATLHVCMGPAQEWKKAYFFVARVLQFAGKKEQASKLSILRFRKM